MVVEEGVDVSSVDESCALRAGEYEVEVHEKSDPRVKWYPGEDKVECVFDYVDEREGHKIHEPWCEDGWVGGLKGFVGHEDREEDG